MKHYIRREKGVVITTAPTDRQVENLIWREMRNAAAISKEFTNIAFPTIHKKKVEFDAHVYGYGMPATKEGVRFHGIHGNVLLIVDEAMGIPIEAWEAMDGIRSSGRVVILAIGNPTFSGGGFYDLFGIHRERWHRITIDAFETPNLEGVTLERLLAMENEELDADPWPFLVKRRWVRDAYLDWVGVGGNEEESPRWLGKVRGIFPRQDPYQLIWTTWIDRAEAAEVPEPSRRRYSAGVDVAGPGEDETSCYVLDQGRVVDFKAWTKADPRADCVEFLEPYRRELGVVNVDSIGIGYYFGLHLADHHFPVSLVNVGEASPEERYRNLKAYAYFKLRDAFMEGRITNLKDETTCAQLATIRHAETKLGVTEIEPKDKMRRRGCKSPDRAEALMLANFGESSASFSIPETMKGIRTTRRMRPD